MTEITVKNAVRCPKFGYGVSTTPTGHGTDIRPPTAPKYTGTFHQIEKLMKEDHHYLSSIQSVYKSVRFFYGGKPIRVVWTFGRTYQDPEDPEKDNYDYAWFIPKTWDQLVSAVDERGILRLRVEE